MLAVHRRITEGQLNMEECLASLVVRSLDIKIAVHAIICCWVGKCQRLTRSNVGKGAK